MAAMIVGLVLALALAPSVLAAGPAPGDTLPPPSAASASDALRARFAGWRVMQRLPDGITYRTNEAPCVQAEHRIVTQRRWKIEDKAAPRPIPVAKGQETGTWNWLQLRLDRTLTMEVVGAGGLRVTLRFNAVDMYAADGLWLMNHCRYYEAKDAAALTDPQRMAIDFSNDAETVVLASDRPLRPGLTLAAVTDAGPGPSIEEGKPGLRWDEPFLKHPGIAAAVARERARGRPKATQLYRLEGRDFRMATGWARGPEPMTFVYWMFERPEDSGGVQAWGFFRGPADKRELWQGWAGLGGGDDMAGRVQPLLVGDLDGDGVDELVVKDFPYEDEGHSILAVEGGKLVRIYGGTTDKDGRTIYLGDRNPEAPYGRID